MKTIKISEELGEEIAYMEVGESVCVEELNNWTLFLKAIVEEYDRHRWAYTSMYVLQHGDDEDNLWGLLYDTGATEDQESGFVYSSPELFPVKAKMIVTYERA